MTAETDTQNEYDENGLPGPGAPTPLSALEVRTQYADKTPRVELLEANFYMICTGRCWPNR